MNAVKISLWILGGVFAWVAVEMWLAHVKQRRSRARRKGDRRDGDIDDSGARLRKSAQLPPDADFDPLFIQKPSDQ